MNINLDTITAEMLKALMKENRQRDPKKYLSEQIKRMYLDQTK